MEKDSSRMTATGSLFALSTVWALGGFLFGLGYFIALRRTVDVLVGGQRRLLAVALTLGRVAAAILLLGVAARFGALPLLTAFLGILLARTLALRAARRIA
jgi:F1-F0 ATPase (N-ATPase) AtpR subunit